MTSREGLLKGKKGIIFGALNEKSIAWQVALKAWGTGRGADAYQLTGSAQVR